MPFGFLENWRDNLKPASYKGRSFFVLSSTTEAGRRAKIWYQTGLVHGKTDSTADITPVVDDFGEDRDTFTIEGYVIANADNDYDYFEQRDLLIGALKGVGPGKLMHPFYGEISVYCKEKARIEESFEEGGIARFTMNFVQVGGAIFVSQGEDFKSLVDETTLDMINEFLDTFLSTFLAVGAFITATVNDIGNLINKIATVVNAVSFGLTSIVNGIINAVLNIANGISALLDAPCDIANAFFDAADQVQNLVGMVDDVEFGGVLGGCSGEQRGETLTLTGDSIPATLGSSTVNALLDNIDFDESELSTTTEEQRVNQALSVDMMKGAMFANIARIGIRIDFDSVEDATEFINKTAEAMDNYLLRLGDSSDLYTIDLYLSMEKLRNTFIESMLKKSINLAREVPYQTTGDVQTTLELAYDKYEDLNRATEIYNRNKLQIKNPGFIPSGDEINILSS